MPLGVAIKGNAVGDEIVDAGGRLLRDEVRDALIDDARAGSEGVGRMQIRAVVGADGGGDASLRPIAGGPFAERRRGEHGHVHWRELQRREQAREAAADDYHVAVRAEPLVGCRGETWGAADA